MYTRGARLAVVALLFAVGGAAAFLLWEIDRRARALNDSAREVARQIDVTTTALADIGLAQHGYVALQDAGATQALVGERMSQFQAAASRLGALTRSERAPGILQAIAREMGELGAVDARAQEYARSGQTFLASDLLSRRGRGHLGRVAGHLRELRVVEAAAADTELLGLREEVLSALAAAAAVWLAGMLLLAFTAGKRRRDVQAPEPQTGTPTSPSPEPSRPAVPTVDLAAAAALCSELSRVTSSAALPSLLARAAGILDARGLIVWMGAGDELFPAAAHGYDTRMLARLAPIGRSTVNATATAWRTGRPGTVKGDGDSPGAIVAPMFNPTHCIGVFAAEVRHGREQDPSARAVTSMIAAQLATIVAAWPAPSAVAPGTAALDRAAGGR